MNKIRSMFTGRRFRAGGYTVFAAAAVVIIAVLVNMVVGALPANITQLDMTAQSLYTLSDQTKRIVKALDKDVTLELLAYSGQEDETVVKLLDQYEALSDHITVSYTDPGVNPGVLETYADEELYANSVIVTCGDVHRFVSYSEIVVTTYDDYYYYTGEYTQEFDGESALTSAIHYVTSDSLPKIYALTGHGETELSSDITDSIEKDNFTVETLSLLTQESVPEDADAIIIHAPSRDISEDEAAMLCDYIDAGGKIVLLTDLIEDGEMANLLIVTEYMGVSAEPGMVIEGDSNYAIRGYDYYLLPDLQDHTVTEALMDAGYYILTPMAQGIVQIGNDFAAVTPILTTSDSSYAKLEGYAMDTTERKDSDTDGPFNVAVVSERGDGKLAWFASANMLNQQIDQIVSGANTDLFMNTLNWMCEQEESISIRAKDMSSPTLTMTSGDASFLSIMVVAVIPAVMVVLGVVIWIRRKRR